MIKEFYYKYRIYIIPGFVGIVCLIISAFIIVPQIIELFKEREKIGVLTNRISLLNNKAKELEGIDEVKLQQELVIALTVLPTAQDVPQAMAALQDIIARSNLSLESTSYSASSKEAGQNSFSLTISVVGSLASTRNFLNDLSEGSRIFKVESISLNILPQSSLVSVDIPLTVYYQAAPSTILTADQPVAKIDAKGEALIANLSKFASQTSVAVSTSAAVPVGKLDPFQ